MREVRAYFNSLLTDRRVAERVRKYLEIETVSGGNIQWVAQFNNYEHKDIYEIGTPFWLTTYPWELEKPECVLAQQFGANDYPEYWATGDGTLLKIQQFGAYIIIGAIDFAATEPTTVDDTLEFGIQSHDLNDAGPVYPFFKSSLQQKKYGSGIHGKQMDSGQAFYKVDPISTAEGFDYLNSFSPYVQVTKLAKVYSCNIAVLKLSSVTHYNSF